MSDEENRDEISEEQSTDEPVNPSRFPEMDELQENIARRIRDNQKFLDHFLDKDYIDEEDDDEDDEDVFEEL